jgi:arginine deiminase
MSAVCRDTGLTASYTFEPLSNLVYTRDQQVTTCKGIVMGRLRSAQRQKEVELMSYCFRKLGEQQGQGVMRAVKWLARLGSVTFSSRGLWGKEGGQGCCLLFPLGT